MINLISKRFFGIAVTRIVSPNRSRVKAVKGLSDAYDICIKAKAIARSAGAEPALAYALNRSPGLKASSKPVLLNTVMTALARENNAQMFWQVFDAKVARERGHWSPELVATILCQISREMESASDAEMINDLFDKATDFYSQAIESLKNPSHLHLHNAYLKCISRSKNVPFLLWTLNLLTKNKFANINLDFFGLKPFLPLEDRHLKLFKLFNELIKSPVELDAQSLTSILTTLARSLDGSIQLAEAFWDHFASLKTESLIIDQPCHTALLLVYRNDLSRIFNSRKLIRSQSWKDRKHRRIIELLQPFGPFASLAASNPKILSIYFEICRNMRFNEKIEEYMEISGSAVEASKDPRLLALIPKRKSNDTRKCSS